MNGLSAFQWGVQKGVSVKGREKQQREEAGWVSHTAEAEVLAKVGLDLDLMWTKTEGQLLPNITSSAPLPDLPQCQQ